MRIAEIVDTDISEFDVHLKQSAFVSALDWPEGIAYRFLYDGSDVSVTIRVYYVRLYPQPEFDSYWGIDFLFYEGSFSHTLGRYLFDYLRWNGLKITIFSSFRVAVLRQHA